LRRRRAMAERETPSWRKNAEGHGRMALEAIAAGADLYWVWMCAFRAAHCAAKVLEQENK
jgi:hypothetical protein